MFYDIKKSGEHIRQLRKQSGYTQEVLAKKLGIDRSLLSHIETGARGCTVDMFIQLSEVFDVSLDLLVFGKERNSKGGDQLKNDIAQLITHLKSFEKKL